MDVVPPEGKVGRKEGNALRLASTVDTSDNQFSLASEEGEEDSSGHGEEM